MKAKRMIEELQKCNPNAEVKLHGLEGENALFVLVYAHTDDVVVIESKSDSDLKEELEVRFRSASEMNMDELEFFTELLEMGFTLEDIQENAPDHYDYSKTFMEEHGLI